MWPVHKHFYNTEYSERMVFHAYEHQEAVRTLEIDYWGDGRENTPYLHRPSRP